MPVTLDDLYARLPTLECKGLCFGTCGPVPCSAAERDRMEAASGKPYRLNGRTCGYLVDNRCSVYSVRPMTCRAFGTLSHPYMRCEHGCKPSRLLQEHEMRALLKQAEKIGGGTVFPRMPG